MAKISAADIAWHLAGLVSGKFRGVDSGGYKISREALLTFAERTVFRESFKVELTGILQADYGIWTIQIDDYLHLFPRAQIQNLREVTSTALKQQGKKIRKDTLSPEAAWPFPN